MSRIEGFNSTEEIQYGNAAIAIHKFREAVNHVLELCREFEKTLRECNKENLRDEFNHLADKHLSQAWWHVAGIAGGAFEMGSSFVPGFESVFKGLGTAATQSVGIGQKFGEGDLVLLQSKVDEIKRDIERLQMDDREAKEEIDEILRTTEKFIESLFRLIGNSVNIN